MQKRTWREYNHKLVNQGSITFYIDEEAFSKPAQKEKRRGRPRLYSLELIQVLLILKIQYGLTYRGLEGFAKSLLPLLSPGILLPTYTLIAKMASKIKLPKLSKRHPMTILIDATGLKVYGEGEWRRKKHGVNKRRKWLKLHVAVDEKTQEIIGIELTDGNVADCTQVDALLGHCPKSVTTVIGDAGYDSHKVRESIIEHGAYPLIPPQRNARLTDSEARNKAAAEIKGLGGDEIARSLWGKATGYSKRALVESAFSRLKRVHGGGLYSRRKGTQTVEVCLKARMLNQSISG